MVPIWLVFKDFKSKWSRTKPVIGVITFSTADFTFLLTYLRGWYNPYVFIPTFTLVVVALTTLFIHLTKHVSYNVGILKAFGARKSTIVTTFYVELMLIGIIGAVSGVLIGVVFLGGLSILTSFNPLDSLSFLEVFSALILSCIFGVLTGAIVGACIVWRKFAEPVVKTLTPTE